MTFYTRKGDEGYTHLLGRERVLKHDLRPEAYGTVDEVTAFIGVARAYPETSERAKNLLLLVQADLWVLMSELAATADFQLPRTITPARITWLEEEINNLATEVPPLKNFVVPGDTVVSASLEVARAVVRRAERGVTRLMVEDELKNKEILRYLNRLSSLLFILARYEEMRAGKKNTLAKELETKA